MKKSTFAYLTVAVLAAVFPTCAQAGTLAVPQKFQEYDQWCWAGCSQAILSYYGKTYTQTAIAQYGTQGYNTWNWLYGYDNVAPYYRRGIDYILSHFGSISSTGRAYALSQGTVASEIAAGRPFVIRWGWAPDWQLGHFIVGRGIIGNTVYFMNPLPGEGYGAGTYDWVVYGSDGSETHKWDYSLQLTTSPPPSAARNCFAFFGGDFSGNSRADIAIFRPSTGLWSIRNVTRVYYGQSGDIPVPGDYNGDGKANIAIFRPTSGLWRFHNYFGPGQHGYKYFGRSGDIPVPGDYNNSGKVNWAIFRPSTGLWVTSSGLRTYFGRTGDIPVPGPYLSRSGKRGRAEIAIFRPSTGLWSIRGSGNYYFGRSGDIPVPGAYTGGSTDTWRPAIFRPSTALWAIRGVGSYYFGRTGDIPVPADYNTTWGDEIAIFRPSTGLWSFRNYFGSGQNGYSYFGRSGDIPVSR
jgi:hypothetical protein